MNVFADILRAPADKTSPDAYKIRWSLEPFATTAWLDAVLDMGSESQEFYARRIHEDVEAQHRLLHCRHPAEVFAIQAEFFQKALTDYRAHTGRMMELGTKALFAQA